MRYCPTCRASYIDDSQQFCLEDGTPLNSHNAAPTEAFGSQSAPTAFIPEKPTQRWDQGRQTAPNTPPNTPFTPPFNPPVRPKKSYKGIITGLLAFLMLLIVGLVLGVWFVLTRIQNSVHTENYDLPTPTTTQSPGKKVVSSDKSAVLSLDKYTRINNGMSYKEVADIIGSPGVEQMRSGTGKYEVTSFKWEGENYSFIYIVFIGDKMNNKTQYGLK